MTLRILDVKYHQLHQSSDTAELPIRNLQWAAVLKSCLAYEAYQRLYISRVEPERVMEFLLLHDEFPHSVRFCLEEAAQALAKLETAGAPAESRQADRLLGRVLSDLRYVELGQLFASGLHPFLDEARMHCARVSRAIQEQCALNYHPVS